MEENFVMVDFEIPVRWIKSHPWEKVPSLKNITLTDENGKAISTIQGEFRLLVENRENQWHKRNVSATLEMSINGEHIVTEIGYVTKPLSDTLQDEYFIEQLDMTYKGHNLLYLMKNTYKLIPTFNLSNLSVEKWRVDDSIPVRDADSNTQGYIYELTGQENMVLEEILFWLPGVTDEHFKNKILYSFSGN